MYSLHPSMPALSATALRRLQLFYFAVSAVLGGVAGGMFGPAPGPLPALAMVSGVLAAQFTIEMLVRRWAWRRALPSIARRDWREAWREASDEMAVAPRLASGLLLGLAIVQFTQGRPIWALSLPNWTGVAAFAVVFLLATLATRRLPSASA